MNLKKFLYQNMTDYIYAFWHSLIKRFAMIIFCHFTCPKIQAYFAPPPSPSPLPLPPSVHQPYTLGWNGLKSMWRALGSSARSFACSLALLTHRIAPHCTLCSRTLLRSFVFSFAHSLTPKLKGKRSCLWIECVDFIVFLPTVHCCH